MYLTPQQVAQTRDHTLSNLLGMSAACLEASRRFAELLASTGRESLHQGSRHLALFGHGQLDALTHFPTTLWLEGSSRQSRMLDHAREIFGEAQKALIQTTESQVRVLDSIVFASLGRLAKNSPWEGEIALKAMRTVLETSEQSLHEISAVAVETLTPSSQEAHAIGESQTEQKTPRNAPAPRPRTRKA
jgi:hypothetical protein